MFIYVTKDSKWNGRMAILQNHRICGALGAPAGTLYPVPGTLYPVRATLPLPLFRFCS